MTDYHGFLKNFQTIINAYQDVGTIYAKLEAQGHLERIISLLMEIFNEEHEFTLTELQRYGKENNQREEDFLEEQYELNSNIFRRNFTLVIQSLAEEMGKSLLDKFKRFYGQNNKKNLNGIKFEQNFIDEQKATGAQKPQYKAEMPEIQEEIESTGKLSPLKSSPKSGRSGTEFVSNTARSFELNIEDLNSRGKVVHEDKQSTPHKTQQDSNPTQTTKPNESATKQQEPLTDVSPILAQRRNEGQRQPQPKSLNAENLMYISAEFKQIKENLKSPSSGREGATEQPPGHYRSISHERTSMGPNKHKANSARGLSPSATGRVPKSATTSISSSKFSVMPGGYEPSIVDSEFGHTRGSSFGKSERAGLFYSNNVPGPGTYEAEDIMKSVQKRAPTASFPRSPKFSVFDKTLNESPGAIYYPSHHFVSK